MNVSRDQAKVISCLIDSTREQELNCNELLERIGEYVDYELSGEAMPAELEPVKHHLSLCRECQEEYEALSKALSHLNHEENE